MSGIRRPSRKKKGKNSKKRVGGNVVNVHVNSTATVHAAPPLSRPAVPSDASTPPSRWARNDKIAIIGVVVMIVGIIVPLMVQRATSATPKDPPPIQTPKPSVPDPPKQEEGPHIKYVPLPHGDPFQGPRTLVTSVPREGEPAQSVLVNGQQVRVMRQEDLQMVLEHKVDASAYVKSSEPMNIRMEIGKDGRVGKVEGIGNDSPVPEDLKDALKQWRFKPFVKDGKDVAVQTVIQLKGEKSEKP